MTIKNKVQLLIIQLLDQCEFLWLSLWNDLGMTVSVFFLCRLKPPCTTCLHLVQTNLLNFTVSIVHYTLLYLFPCFLLMLPSTCMLCLPHVYRLEQYSLTRCYISVHLVQPFKYPTINIKNSLTPLYQPWRQRESVVCLLLSSMYRIDSGQNFFLHVSQFYFLIVSYLHCLFSTLNSSSFTRASESWLQRHFPPPGW